MCVAYIFTKLWTGKFFGFLARSSDITTTERTRGPLLYVVLQCPALPRLNIHL